MDLVTSYHRKTVPTIGGMVMFGLDRLKYFPDAWIQAGRFSGTSKMQIIDTQEIFSYPIIAIDDAINFVKKHAMRAIEIKGVRHTEAWNMPLTAIRDAIINAVVHADYSQIGAPIRIAIFDDRIEIENPGLLMFGLTVDDIKRGVSKLRNRVIGQLFYRLGLIERWGSGIRRIVGACFEAGFAESKFEEIGTLFRVTIYTYPVGKTYLSEVEHSIMTALQNTDDGLSTKEIAKAIKKSERTTRTRLIGLIEKGLVIEVGQGMNDSKRKYFCKH